MSHTPDISTQISAVQAAFINTSERGPKLLLDGLMAAIDTLRAHDELVAALRFCHGCIAGDIAACAEREQELAA